MKQLILNIVILCSFVSFGNEAFEEGNELYESGDYQAAIDKYSSIIASEEHAVKVYYNLGNAYYRNNEIGKAIWAYESALKIQADHEDALFNLDLTNAQTIDKIDTNRHGFGHWISALIFSVSINFWAYLSIGLSIIACGLLIMFFQTKKQKIKNLSLMVSFIAIIGLVVSIVFAHLHKNQIIDNEFGVVIQSSVDVKVSPIEDANTTFILSEGAKVEVLEMDKNGWLKINVNGNQGWLKNESIWEI